MEFTKKRGIHGKDVEFTEMAWNSRYGMESAGVVLVMWGVECSGAASLTLSALRLTTLADKAPQGGASRRPNRVLL